MNEPRPSARISYCKRRTCRAWERGYSKCRCGNFHVKNNLRIRFYSVIQYLVGIIYTRHHFSQYIRNSETGWLVKYTQYDRETYPHARCSGVFTSLSVQDGLHERSSTRYCTDFRYPYLQEGMNINRMRSSSYLIGPFNPFLSWQTERTHFWYIDNQLFRRQKAVYSRTNLV